MPHILCLPVDDLYIFRHKVKSFECKWFIPISNVNVDTKYTDDSSYSCKDDIEAMKKKIVTLKSELRREVRRNHESFVSYI